MIRGDVNSLSLEKANIYCLKMNIFCLGEARVSHLARTTAHSADRTRAGLESPGREIPSQNLFSLPPGPTGSRSTETVDWRRKPTSFAESNRRHPFAGTLFHP